MKLVGSYTSPFVRKLSILLLEKGITFEFINELPYNADNGVAQFNPLGKVPVLVTEEGECWFDSPIIAEYNEWRAGDVAARSAGVVAGAQN